MSHIVEGVCNIPDEPVALGAVTSCGVCGEMYQAVFVEADVTTLADREQVKAGSLQWVRLDLVPEAERTADYPKWGDPPVQAPNQLLPVPDPVVDDEDLEVDTLTYRIEYLKVPFGTPAPVTIDMGRESGILIQPKPDQAEGEVALNIVAYGQWDPSVVAWLMGMASEQLTTKLRVENLMNGVGK